MKKYLLIILLLLPCSLWGMGVSPDSAKEIADRFFSGFPGTRSNAGEVRLLWDGRTVTRGLITDPPFYVYGRENGGFVIVAGEDCMHPILGYSDRNVFQVNGMPEHVRLWFEGLSDLVREAREKGSEPSQKTRSEWVQVRSEVHTPVVEFKTAQWDQRSPFNLFMPEINGQRCLTGCGTTATAILMRYHKWPEKGHGILPQYSYQTDSETRVQPGHALGHSYNWENMPLTNVPVQNTDIAQLMLDIGVMNQCLFGIASSGTYTMMIPPGLGNYMDYDRRICVNHRDEYGTDEWESLIRKELDEGRPIIYQGYRPEDEGHLWVIDGYSADGYFSMNWGWGGYNNGYYLISPMEKTGESFSLNHAAIFPIKPATSEDPFNIEDYLLVYNAEAIWNYRKNDKLYFYLWIMNRHWGETGLISIRTALTDKDGKPKQWLNEPTPVNIMGGRIQRIEGESILSDDLSPDDRIMVFMEKNGEWIPLKCREGAVIRFKSDLPIEEITTVTYNNSQKGKTLIIDSDTSSYIELHGRNQYGTTIQTSSMGRLELQNFDHYGSSLHITVRNLAETKEFDIILRKSN